MNGISVESSGAASQAESDEHKVKARVDAVWQEMNKGVSAKTLNSILNKPGNKKAAKDKVSDNWKSYLGLGTKKTEAKVENREKKSSENNSEKRTSDEAKKLAAAALAAAKDAATSFTFDRGMIQVTEVRDFAGQEIQVKKMVDPTSKEAAEHSKVQTGASSAVDIVLEQIKKRPKLSLLDKTKKDWGEFKEENKDYGEELDAYKKSSNQYLDKVSFLHRTDYREFERERDARLAQQAKRMRDDP